VCNSAEPNPPRGIRRAISATMRRLRASESGAVAVEFALVIGVLLMIIGATVEFGRALMARNEMNFQVSRAARTINLDGTQTDDDVQATLSGLLDDFDPDTLEIAAESTTISGTDFVRITVDFPFDIKIPFVNDSTVTLNVETLVPVIGPIL
jgi:Flp pilus assembly protein TadG